MVELRVRPQVCDGASAGFGPNPGDQVTTVLFTPPSGPQRAVVLATDCSPFTPAVLSACATQLSGIGATATCGVPDGTAMVPGSAVRVENDPQTGEARLQVRFPNTDALLAPAGDDLTGAGPAKLVVTQAGAPLPCDLATVRCADAVAAPGGPLRATIVLSASPAEGVAGACGAHAYLAGECSASRNGATFVCR